MRASFESPWCFNDVARCLSIWMRQLRLYWRSGPLGKRDITAKQSVNEGGGCADVRWRGVQVEEDPTGGKFAGVGGALNSAHHKLEDVIQFHLGDVATAVQRGAMQPGGQEALIYGTIMGALGAPRAAPLQPYAPRHSALSSAASPADACRPCHLC